MPTTYLFPQSPIKNNSISPINYNFLQQNDMSNIIFNSNFLKHASIHHYPTQFQFNENIISAGTWTQMPENCRE